MMTNRLLAPVLSKVSRIAQKTRGTAFVKCCPDAHGGMPLWCRGLLNPENPAGGRATAFSVDCVSAGSRTQRASCRSCTHATTGAGFLLGFVKHAASTFCPAVRDLVC